MSRIAPVSVLLLAALLTGCGGGDDSPAAPPAAPDAGAPAPDAPLPRYTTLDEIGQATAAQQKIDKTARISLNGGLSGQTQSGLSGEGTLRYDDAGAAMQITQKIQAAAGAPQELALVVLPDNAYIRPPPGPSSGLPAGKSWVHIKPTATDPVSVQFNQMVQAIRDNADPTKSFAQFGDAITITDAAEEQLDGQRTMRYRLKVDLAKAAERQPDPALKQSLQQSVQSGLGSLEYTLWLDAQNRLSRVLVDQPLPQNQGTFTLDARYRDWGQPVQIDPPPADQVLER
jgi:hypothetical protein